MLNRLVRMSCTQHILELATRKHIGNMSTTTGRITEYYKAVRTIYVLGIAFNGVASQLSSSPVVVRESQTASFRWQVSAVTDGSTVNTIYVISPSRTTVLLAGTVNNSHLTAPDYTARVTYTGNLAANPRIMAFDLRSVVSSDAGDYVCGKNGPSVIIPQCGQKLVVPGQPTKPTLNGSSAPVFGKQFTLTCSSSSTTAPADHGLTLTYTWQRDNTDITVTSPGSPFTFTVSSRDSHYRCKATEDQGLESEWSQLYNMEPQYGPYQISLTPSTSSYTVTEHQALPSITCSALCRPGCSYRWFHNGTTVSSGTTLSLGQADRSKTGSYRCQPNNTHGSSDSVTVSVDVQYPVTIIMFTANSLSRSLTVNESDTVTLRCQTDSNPRSVIRILNGTEELTRADNSLRAEYRLESADCRQRGNYSCTASNNIGTPVSQGVELLVKCSPRLDETVAQQLKYASRLGGNVNLSVSVLAYPLPTFTWSRTTSTSQDLTGSSSPVPDISVTARLHLTNLKQQDFGDYSLTANNGESSSVTFSIVSEGPPQIPTQFRDLDNATTSSVWLSWLPGFNGGHPQTFLLEYRQFATRTWTVYKSYADTGKMMVVEVTGLTPGDIHIFRLHARNDYVDSNRYVFVETRTAGDPPNQQKLETPCSCTGLIAGTTVGGILLTLLIGGIVLMVLYRKGYKFGHTPKETASRKSTRNPETVEMDNRGYSSLDQINGPAQYSNLEESEKKQYSQLKIYENTKADAAADTSTYEGMTETPPVTYESISASPYQNTGAHSQGPDHGNK
ncbi:protein turtle homolog B-like [Haliotis rufescens]|uniref:protein turtle homolog B-like n=1 Tax=Haliotis rufescens TaxID=6454 RepID=UPI00201F2619|nr:protein turtle homolog B-like [Haliotis rufescens]